MSMPERAVLRRSYGKAARQVAADAGGIAVLDFGSPPAGQAWLVTSSFYRSAAAQIVRQFIGGTAGTVDPIAEVDGITADPAVSGGDEYYVEAGDVVWAQISGVPAATVCAGQIRYRILESEV
jgi:hypothetical protein